MTPAIAAVTTVTDGPARRRSPELLPVGGGGVHHDGVAEEPSDERDANRRSIGDRHRDRIAAGAGARDADRDRRCVERTTPHR